MRYVQCYDAPAGRGPRTKHSARSDQDHHWPTVCGTDDAVVLAVVLAVLTDEHQPGHLLFGYVW